VAPAIGASASSGGWRERQRCDQTRVGDNAELMDGRDLELRLMQISERAH
jgi:hypothetical protein